MAPLVVAGAFLITGFLASCHLLGTSSPNYLGSLLAVRPQLPTTSAARPKRPLPDWKTLFDHKPFTAKCNWNTCTTVADSNSNLALSLEILKKAVWRLSRKVVQSEMCATKDLYLFRVILWFLKFIAHPKNALITSWNPPEELWMLSWHFFGLGKKISLAPPGVQDKFHPTNLTPKAPQWGHRKT